MATSRIRTVGVRLHNDDRRLFAGAIFPTEGDVNVIHLWTRKPIAWHRHQRQTDYVFCAQGAAVVCLVPPGSMVPRAHYLDEMSEPIALFPNCWHGYQDVASHDVTTILVSYLSHKYDPTDEERAPLDAFPWPTTTA